MYKKVSSQFFHVVQPKKGSIHELGDAIPLHLQRLERVHPFESEAVHYLDLVALQFTTTRKASACSVSSSIIHKTHQQFFKIRIKIKFIL